VSTLKAEVVTIDRVKKHPNADRLDCVIVKGWNVVAGRDDPSTPRYKQGDKCLYIPIDSVLPEPLETLLFPPDGKIKLSKSRIKTIKLRGAVSQGMITDLEGLEALYPGISLAKVGDDLTEELGIIKYEPPVEDVPQHMQAKNAQHLKNPNFRKYTDIENFKNHNRLFEDGEMVYITEKLHGTSARYAMLETMTNRWWKKVLKFFGLLPKYEFCYGSRNVQLQGPGKKKFYYDENVYAKIAKQLRLDEVLQPGEALFGEIVGSGIQKGYTYGCAEGEHRFYAYDVNIDGRWLPAQEFMEWCDSRGIERVPFISICEYNEQFVRATAKGPSAIGNQPVREGIVIKAAAEENCYIGRKVLKLINEDYELAKDNTEFH